MKKSVADFLADALNNASRHPDVAALIAEKEKGATQDHNAINLAGSEASTNLLFGGLAGDQIQGGAGADLLAGGQGNDTLHGGGGSDWYLFSEKWGNELLVDSTGDDTIDLSSILNPLKINLNSSAGFEVIGKQDRINWENNAIENAIAGFGNDALYGNAVQNFLSGQQGNDKIYAGAGHDTTYGGDGFDTLYGDEGNDLINGNTGDDRAYGGSGDDFLLGESGNDFLSGGAEKDTISGGTGNDTLSGGTADDKLSGNAGNDTLSGESGNDKLLGGDGNDLLNGDNGNDVLNGESGNDTLLGDKGNDILSGGDGNDVLNGNAGNDDLLGGAGNDTLLGEDGHDKIKAGDGDDVLNGGAGNNTLYGESGNDLYIFQNALSHDNISDLSGNDTLDFSQITMNATINLDSQKGGVRFDGSSGKINWHRSTLLENTVSGSGHDSITGNGVANHLQGGNGNDFINAGSGNDSLTGGQGHDTLWGGLGDDSYSYASGDGQDVIRDEGDIDTLHLTDFEQSDITWKANDTNNDGFLDELELKVGGTESIRLQNYFDNTSTTMAGSNYGSGLIENILLSNNSLDFQDVINSNYIYGTVKDDVLTGTNGNDHIHGLGGSDIVSGGMGNDVYLTNSNGFNSLTITDSDGAADELKLSEFQLSDVVSWHGVDTDGNALSDELIINMGAKGFVAIQNYFNNATGNTAGTGLIETLRFSNGIMNFNTVNPLLPIMNVINGTDAGDSMRGTNAADLFISKGGYRDYFNANSGSGMGNDVLLGGRGNGTWNDDNYYLVDVGNDIIVTGTGANTYEFMGAWGHDIIQNPNNLTTTSNHIGVSDSSPTPKNLFISYENRLLTDGTNTVRWDANVSMNSFGTAFGNDYIDFSAATQNMRINSWRGHDTVYGGSGNDTIFTGHDTADSTAVVYAGLGNDTIDNGWGADTIYGGDGNDTYKGNRGHSLSTWTADADIISDSSGSADVLDLSSYHYKANTSWRAADTDNNGFIDRLDVRFKDSSSIAVLNYFSNSGSNIGGSGSLEIIKFRDAADLTYSQMYALITTPTVPTGFNNMTGTSSNNLIVGQSGADYLWGGEGNDTIQGGAGNDLLEGMWGNDSLNGGDGNDQYKLDYYSGHGNDVIVDGSGDDRLSWDPLTPKNNIVFFKNGNDLQIGYVGNNTDMVTIKDQFVAGNEIEQFETTGYSLSNTEVNQLIQDMSAYAANNGISLTSIADVKNNTALVEIANNAWHG